jgi:hypothetical protein
MQNNSLPWHVAEKAIEQEIKWLNSVISDSDDIMAKKDHCKTCIMRRIAILIVTGRIKAKEINSSTDLWKIDKYEINKKIHGKEWHSTMMNKINEFFTSTGYTVTQEPYLNQGRADLGVYKEGERNIFVEVGTISINKLLINLESMEGVDFLLVLGDEKVIEFSIIKAGYLNEQQI